jgi:hypothetical protein
MGEEETAENEATVLRTTQAVDRMSIVTTEMRADKEARRITIIVMDMPESSGGVMMMTTKRMRAEEGGMKTTDITVEATSLLIIAMTTTSATATITTLMVVVVVVGGMTTGSTVTFIPTVVTIAEAGRVGTEAAMITRKKTTTDRKVSASLRRQPKQPMTANMLTATTTIVALLLAPHHPIRPLLHSPVPVSVIKKNIQMRGAAEVVVSTVLPLPSVTRGSETR